MLKFYSRFLLDLVPFQKFVILFVFIIHLFFSGISFSQKLKEQDVVSVFRTQIKNLHQDSEYGKAIFLIDSVLNSSSLSNKDRISILLDKQISFYYLGQVDSMKVGLNAIDKIIKSNHPYYNHYLYSLCLLDGALGNYTEAIKKLLELISLCEKSDDRSLLISVFNSIGVNYVELNDFERAKNII